MNPPHYPEAPLPAGAQILSTDGAHQMRLDVSGLDGLVLLAQQTSLRMPQRSAMAAASVRSSVVAFSPGSTGISHVFRGIKRHPITGVAQVAWQSPIFDEPGKQRWYTQIHDDVRRITYVEELPWDKRFNWIESLWFAKGSGTAYLSNFEMRGVDSVAYYFGNASTVNYLAPLEVPYTLSATTSGVRYAVTLGIQPVRIFKGDTINATIDATMGATVESDTAAGTRRAAALYMLRFRRQDLSFKNYVIARVNNDDGSSTLISEQPVDESIEVIADADYSQVELQLLAYDRYAVRTSDVEISSAGFACEITVTSSLVGSFRS